MQGDGSRQGTGKCSCNSGYSGTTCSDCAGGHFEESRNDSHVVCQCESLINFNVVTYGLIGAAVFGPFTFTRDPSCIVTRSS
jgi:protein disulfide-isomerase